MPVKSRPPLKPHEERVLHVFGVFPRLTIAQLANLPPYSPSSVKHVSTVLKGLEDKGYLLHGYKEGAASPVHHFVYTPDTHGREFLRRAGYTLPDQWRRGQQAKFGSNFMEHTLEISDILIAAINAGRYDARIHTGGVMHDEFMGARVTTKLAVKPDGFVPMAASGKDVSFAVELDRSGKEDESVWRRKVAGYLRDGAADYLRIFGTPYLTVAVVVNPIRQETRIGTRKTPEELRAENRREAGERLEQLAAWTAAESAHLGYGEYGAQCFHFTIERATDYTPKEAASFFLGTHWYQPYEPDARPFIFL